MRSILAIMNRLDTAPAVLSVAEQISAIIPGSRITALHPRLPEDPTFMPTEEVMTTERRLAFNVASAELADGLRDVFDQWRSGSSSNASARWIEVIGDAGKSVGADGSRADLIIVGHVMASDQKQVRAAFNAALHDAAAPVVMAPLAYSSELGRHPAIAWEHSAAIDKAVQAAWPILLKADRITILMAHEHRRSDEPPKAVQESLERAGISCRVLEFGLANRHVGDALLQKAHEIDADFLIMGAHTHSEFVEWLRGGATQELLEHAMIPLLMHH